MSGEYRVIANLSVFRYSRLGTLHFDLDLYYKTPPTVLTYISGEQQSSFTAQES